MIPIVTKLHNQISKPPWRRSFRLWLDRWRALTHRRLHSIYSVGRGPPRRQLPGPPRADFSDPRGPRPRGVDTAQPWAHGVRRATAPAFRGRGFRLARGDLLLRVFAQHLSDSAELHIVSSQAPEDLPGRVHVHRDLQPNDPRLIALYASCDLLVLPTNADLVPWSVLEAMAMQLPVVSTDVGAIPEIVVHDVTVIVPAGARAGQRHRRPAIRSRFTSNHGAARP